MESIKKISSTVSDREDGILQNAMSNACIAKATEKLLRETALIKKQTAKLVKEDGFLEVELKELKKTLSIQQDTLSQSEYSLRNQQALKKSLSREAKEMREKYDSLLDSYREELKEWRFKYENGSETYQTLKKLQIQIKKLQIQELDLDVKIKMTKISQNQYEIIQRQIFYRNVVRFARFYIINREHEMISQQLQQLKVEENESLTKFLQFQEASKQPQRMIVPRMPVNKISEIDLKLTQKDTKMVEIGETCVESSNKLQQFMNEELQHIPLINLESNLNKMPVFNSDSSKVRILDVKVVKPKIEHKKTAINFKKRMEIEMKKVLQSSRQAKTSSAKSTPACSQQEIIIKDTPQNEPEKPIRGSQESEKALSQTKSILKRNDDNLNETTSKYFSTKKSVAFEPDSIQPIKDSKEELNIALFGKQFPTNTNFLNMPSSSMFEDLKINQKPIQTEGPFKFGGEFNSFTSPTTLSGEDGGVAEMDFDPFAMSSKSTFTSGDESFNAESTQKFKFFGSSSTNTNFNMF